MRLLKITIGLILLSTLTLNTPAQSVFYAASKSGLNLREQPNAGATVLTKIPYGAKVTKATQGNDGQIETEGMNAGWQRILYEGRPGYVADVYLLPFPPPQGTSDDLDGYLNSISKSVGTAKKSITYSTEETLSTTRTLYENGMAIRHFSGYEYSSETLWVPGINMHQGFVLARLLSSFKALLSTADAFPSKSVDGGDNGRSILVQYTSHWLSAIRYEWCEGACYTIELRDEEGEISITFSGGV